MEKLLWDGDNHQLANVERPSFIGPFEITSLDFGSAAPGVELVDLRDFYCDFLKDRNVHQDGYSRVLRRNEGFEWISRRAGAAAALDMGRDELRQRLAYRYLPPHIRLDLAGLQICSPLSPPRSPLDPCSVSGGPAIPDLRSTVPWHTLRLRQMLSEGFIDPADLSVNIPTHNRSKPLWIHTLQSQEQNPYPN